MAGSGGRGDMIVLARPADAPGIELADAGGRLLAQKLRQAFVAKAAAGSDGVVVMMARRVGHFFAKRHRDRHLRHDRRAAAADQAAVDEENAGAAA